MRLHPLSIFSVCSSLLIGAAAPLALANPITYQVTVDTSSLAVPPPAQYGYIDMQFNPAILAGQQSATANVSNFATNGVLNSNSADPNNGTQGNVTGNLGTSLMFNTGTSLNEFTEDLTFGTKITFDLTLDGAMIETPNNQGGGATFYLDFLDPSGNFLLTNDPSGSTATGFFAGFVTINPNGTTTVTANPGPNGGASDVTFTALSSPGSTVPEPSTWLLMASGWIGIAAFARRRRHYGVPLLQYRLAMR